MNHYIYNNHKDKTSIIIEDICILEADEQYKLLIGLDVIKSNNIGCQINFGSKCAKE